VTLIGTAYNLAPIGAWFPPFIETAIAASIFYMAIEGNPPNVAVRSGLAGGGGSHERTRLWTAGFPASWENTGNFLRRASTLHHIAIKRRVVSSTCWPIP